MSNANQETIADIVAAMRNEGHAGDESCLEWVGAKMRTYADRIEAAHQREVAVVLKDRDEMFKSEQETVAKTKEWFDEYQKLKREVSELRECLKEAIREKCPFTRMSCKHGEPCDYECGTVKWRKALQDEGGEK